MAFRRILIAVDNEPIPAHAIDAGAELAQALGAAVALINVVGSALGYPADTGVSPNELIASAKQQPKKLLATFADICVRSRLFWNSSWRIHLLRRSLRPQKNGQRT